MNDRIRVLRVIEYVGPREWVKATVSRAVHGTRYFESKGQITAVTLGEFGESIAEVHSEDQNLTRRGPAVCHWCGKYAMVRKLHRPSSRPGGISQEGLACERCENGMMDFASTFDDDPPMVIPFHKREGLD